jgi:hypothetical protein
MKDPHRDLRLPLVVLLATCALWICSASACSDSETDSHQPTGGGGNGANGGNGGFAMGPAGPGPGGNAGEGGQGNNGGTGEPTFEWDNTYGGTGTVTPQGVAVDTLGNVIVVGSFTGTVNLGGADLTSAGMTDAFFAKYNSAGAHQWSFSVGDGADQSALSVATDSQNRIWVSGTLKGAFSFLGGPTLDAAGVQFPDCWVAQLGPANGDHIHSAAYPGPTGDLGASDFGRAVATGPSDQAVFAGTFQISIAFGGPELVSPGASYSMFVVRYDQNFNITLEKQFGGTGREEALATAVAVDGAIAVGGSTDGDIDFGGGVLSPVGTGTRAVVAKLGAGGQQAFAKLFESGGDAAVTGVAFNEAGDLFATGYFSQSIDLGEGPLMADGAAKEIFIARFDTNGNLTYGRRFGGTGLEEPAGIAVDSQGFAAITGRFNDDFVVNQDTTLTYGAMANDAFLLRVGASGNGFWGYSLSAIQDARGRAVAIDPADDNILMVGEFSGQIDLGSGPKGAGAIQNMFVAKYGP